MKINVFSAALLLSFTVFQAQADTVSICVKKLNGATRFSSKCNARTETQKYMSASPTLPIPNPGGIRGITVKHIFEVGTLGSASGPQCGPGEVVSGGGVKFPDNLNPNTTNCYTNAMLPGDVVTAECYGKLGGQIVPLRESVVVELSTVCSISESQ